MPIATNIMRQQRHGNQTGPETRCNDTRRSGSTAIISRLEICSVAFIRPISAVNAEPARPANSKAVTTGPSSRSSDKRDHHAQTGFCTVSGQYQITLQPQHHANKQPGHHDDQQRKYADAVELLDEQQCHCLRELRPPDQCGRASDPARPKAGAGVDATRRPNDANACS
jgi:hypothetical protein